MEKKKVVMLFPHLPNPRMIKRINALKENYNVEVIYWDRGLEFNKVNKIPPAIKNYVLRAKANEGNPLGRLFITLKVMNKALNLIRTLQPDFLYISKTDMLMVGVLYKFFKNPVKIIYEVSDLHSLLIDRQKGLVKNFVSQVLKRLEKQLCKYISLLVVTSEYFYKYFYGDIVEEKKLLFIPNTPELKIFEGFTRSINKKFTVGFIGSVRYGEQIKMLINAAEKCKTNVFIAGKGIDYENIKEYSMGKDYVQIYGSYEYEQEIKMLYSKVDCIYSVYDASKKNVQIALPNRLYEALYTNTPIIAAKETYLGEIVDKYKLGKVVSHNEVDELIEAINELKSSEDIFSQIETNATKLREEWVLEKFNKELLIKIKNIE
jgi:succinoglycan biosynthesis protein ExoL